MPSMSWRIFAITASLFFSVLKAEFCPNLVRREKVLPKKQVEKVNLVSGNNAKQCKIECEQELSKPKYVNKFNEKKIYCQFKKGNSAKRMCHIVVANKIKIVSVKSKKWYGGQCVKPSTTSPSSASTDSPSSALTTSPSSVPSPSSPSLPVLTFTGNGLGEQDYNVCEGDCDSSRDCNVSSILASTALMSER